MKNRNTGDRNTGYSNIGDRNTGNRNTGDWNTGYRNTGNWNTGNWNTGYSNTGNWNNVDKETGHFNTIQGDTIRVFNNDCSIEEWDNADKPSFIYFDLIEFIEKNDMTIEEKSANPTYETTGGYLKKYEYKEAFQKSWENASQEDKDLLFRLPNFDADVFKEISGIDVTKKTKELTVADIEKLLGHKIKIVK